MTFSAEGWYAEPWKEFTEDQARWMAGFASANIKNPSGETYTKLESVFIDFNPECDSSSLYDDENRTWPWEYWQQAEQELARCNVIMKHSEPGCTRDGWDQIIIDHRKVVKAEAALREID